MIPLRHEEQEDVFAMAHEEFDDIIQFLRDPHLHFLHISKK